MSKGGREWVFSMAQTRTELGCCVHSEKYSMSKVKMIFDAHIFYLHFECYVFSFFSPCFQHMKMLLKLKGVLSLKFDNLASGT